MFETQDNNLFLKIKEDNHYAFEIVFFRYYSGLCAYAAGILGDMAAGEEIVQDLFVKLWDTRKNLNITVSLKAYLYRTVHNQCLNLIESRKIRLQYSKDQANHYGFVSPFTGEYPIANLIVRELDEKIRESVNALPDQCRQVFMMIRVYNNSYEETAKKLNISVNTVKTQMQRSLAKLREMLKEYFPS